MGATRKNVLITALAKSTKRSLAGPAQPRKKAKTVPQPPVAYSGELNIHNAKSHLISADPAFKQLIDVLPAKPWEEPPGEFDPFKSLCTSILGQQISWLAARSITHKFIRLYFPDLPEKYDSSLPKIHFPTPQQVASTDITTLRSAGLSQRKAEYVQDLAARFSDGRLSTDLIRTWNDDQVMEELCKVRGIGKWTVEMFLIFSLKRFDILSCGDLGIQKGLIKFYVQENPQIHPEKAVKPKEDAHLILEHETPPIDSEPVVITRPLFKEDSALSLSVLKARLNKKIKGGMYLSPDEMYELTESWRPFRSVASLYLWSIVDGPAA